MIRTTGMFLNKNMIYLFLFKIILVVSLTTSAFITTRARLIRFTPHLSGRVNNKNTKLPERCGVKQDYNAGVRVRFGE